MKFTFGLWAFAAVCLLVCAAAAQRTISVGSPVTENFDSLGTANTSVTDNTTIAGVYTFRTTGNASPNIFTAGTGSSNAGNLYNFGSAAASDRALGTQTTSATQTTNLGLRLLNNGATPITRLRVQYTGEQWRRGNGAAETLAFAYQTGATVTSLTTGTYTAVASLNFVSPYTATNNTARDGNAAANRTLLDQTISVNIPAGTEIMLRWQDVVESAQADGFGVDDITITALPATAGDATITGRVTDSFGRAISSAAISVQDITGVPKIVYTNTFGYYSVKGLEVGQTYILGVSARRYTFANPTMVVNLGDNVDGANFVAKR